MARSRCQLGSSMQAGLHSVAGQPEQQLACPWLMHLTVSLHPGLCCQLLWLATLQAQHGGTVLLHQAPCQAADPGHLLATLHFAWPAGIAEKLNPAVSAKVS